ncbi:MAG TPA: hypothetical protein DCF46_10625 [Porphyromonadaceae bacterium]|jgi:excisionase family DNA binding protein|nr:hypothetical protein [Porphyromonadaceae bacterium]
MTNFIEAFKSEIRQMILDEMAKQQVKEETGEERERLLTTDETCEFLRCSKPTLHRWKKRGIVPHVRIGTNIRYKESDLRKLTKK